MTKRKIDRKVLLTLILLLVIGVCFAVALNIIYRNAHENCLNTIEDTAQQAVYTLQYSMELNRYQLNTIAEMLPQDLTQDPEGISAILNSLCATRAMSALYIQLPDGSILRGGQNLPDFGGFHSYDHELHKLPYISDLLGPENSRFIYQAVPIVRNGQPAGILYGFLNVKSFPSFFNVTAYDGHCALYIVDGNTGDFLMDTWHNQLSNLYDASLGDREIKSGYSREDMIERIRTGRDGYFVFKSQTIGDWMYTYYQPAGINNWSIQVTIAESIAFREANSAHTVIILLGTVVLLLLASYLFWILYQQQRLNRQNSQQLQRSSYMYDVQQILFNAYERPEQVGKALECIGTTLCAESAELLSMKGRFVHHTYSWIPETASIKGKTQGRNLLRDFPHIYTELLQGKSILHYQQDPLGLLSPEELDHLSQRSIHNMMVVPLVDEQEQLCGILAVLNMNKKWSDCSMLEAVAPDFLQTLKGIDSYQLLHNMGIIDSLTGLRNRNCFENSLAQYANTPCCILYSIYIDVNGLHEINNTFGHSAGDSMLRTVSGQVRSIFGDQHTYRLGGDEFAVFVMDLEESELLEKIEDLKQSVRSYDYHISVGYAAQNGKAINIDTLVLDAENRMYQDKQSFYQQFGSEKSIRAKDNQLDKLIQEKNDVDSFLELISSYYMGICIIDPKKDVARVLYNPGYFAEILAQNNFRYQASIRQYAESYVQESDREAFLAFCQYDRIEDKLSRGQKLKLAYFKVDGNHICLRIFPTRNHTPEKPELFWFFEKLPE